MNEFLFSPAWQQLSLILTLWAILCVGICLPLITWKLYTQNDLKPFPKEPPCSRFDDHAEKNPFQ